MKANCTLEVYRVLHVHLHAPQAHCAGNVQSALRIAHGARIQIIVPSMTHIIGHCVPLKLFSKKMCSTES